MALGAGGQCASRRGDKAAFALPLVLQIKHTATRGAAVSPDYELQQAVA